MDNKMTCEYCNRPIVDGGLTKVLRKETLCFCSEFCYRFYFYKIPLMDYEGMKEFYADRCISEPVPDYKKYVEGAK